MLKSLKAPLVHQSAHKGTLLDYRECVQIVDRSDLSEFSNINARNPTEVCTPIEADSTMPEDYISQCEMLQWYLWAFSQLGRANMARNLVRIDPNLRASSTFEER